MSSLCNLAIGIIILLLGVKLGVEVGESNIARDCDILHSTIINDEVYNCASTRSFVKK